VGKKEGKGIREEGGEERTGRRMRRGRRDSVNSWIYICRAVAVSLVSSHACLMRDS
jgi:hypothetical protein